MKRYVIYFNRSGEQLAGEYELQGVPLARLQKLFGLNEDDPVIAEYPIETDEQRLFFEQLTGVKFDSSRFLYFLSNYASYPGERTPDSVTTAAPLLREATADDWSSILAVANEALPNAPDGNAGWLKARRSFDETARRRRHYVAEGGGEILAYGAIEEAADRRWRVFIVMAAARLADGLGDLMLEQLLRDMRELGGSVAWMREQADDARFLTFLAQRRFVESRRFVVRDGSLYDGVDVVELERPIDVL